MASEGAPWTLSIPSDLRLLSLARAFVSAFCDSAGLDEPTTNGIVLACDEATNNVMRHAHLDPSELRIGGRGVFLMRSIMDELTCQPRGEKGNALRMVKLRSARRA